MATSVRPWKGRLVCRPAPLSCCESPAHSHPAPHHFEASLPATAQRMPATACVSHGGAGLLLPLVCHASSYYYHSPTDTMLNEHLFYCFACSHVCQTGVPGRTYRVLLKQQNSYSHRMLLSYGCFRAVPPRQCCRVMPPQLACRSWRCEGVCIEALEDRM